MCSPSVIRTPSGTASHATSSASRGHHARSAAASSSASSSESPAAGEAGRPEALDEVLDAAQLGQPRGQHVELAAVQDGLPAERRASPRSPRPPGPPGSSDELADGVQEALVAVAQPQQPALGRPNAACTAVRGLGDGRARRRTARRRRAFHSRSTTPWASSVAPLAQIAQLFDARSQIGATRCSWCSERVVTATNASSAASSSSSAERRQRADRDRPALVDLGHRRLVEARLGQRPVRVDQRAVEVGGEDHGSINP